MNICFAQLFQNKYGYCIPFFFPSTRLTPAYMLVLMTEATLSPYFADGPVYPPQGFEVDYCEKSWWKNLLYINNLFDPTEMVTKLGVVYRLCAFSLLIS